MRAEEPHTRNGILAALHPKDFARLGPAEEVVELERETLLYEAGGLIEQVYFPITRSSPWWR